MVASDEEQGNEGHLTALLGFQLGNGRVQSGIAFNAGHVAVVVTVSPQHVVHLRVDGRGGSFGTVTNEEHMLALLRIGGMAVYEDVTDLKTIVNR